MGICCPGQFGEAKSETMLVPAIWNFSADISEHCDHQISILDSLSTLEQFSDNNTHLIMICHQKMLL
jgi:hypothetical protein